MMDEERLPSLLWTQTMSGLIGSVQASAEVPADGLFVCYQHTDNLCLRGGSRVQSQVKSSDFVNDTVTPNTAAVRLSPVTSDTKRPLQ